jgi:hypothetical protein
LSSWYARANLEIDMRSNVRRHDAVFSLLLLAACAKESDGGGETTSTSVGGTLDEGGSEATSFGSTMPGDGTGTSAADTGGTAAGSDDEGPTFVLRPDTPPMSECDPKLQDCPEGEKCTAWANDGGSSWNANKCVEVTGTGVDGDPCTVEGSGVSGIDDCAKGYMCWDVDPQTAMGVCVAFCDPNDVCPPGTICAIQNDGVLPLCSVSCDPIVQDCPEGQGCYAKDGDNGELICIPDASGTAGLDGDPCEFDNVCDPGLVCIGGSAGCMTMWCCTPWCDLTEPNTCPGAGEECVAHFDDPPPGTENVGICVVPQ